MSKPVKVAVVLVVVIVVVFLVVVTVDIVIAVVFVDIIVGLRNLITLKYGPNQVRNS